MPSACGNSQQCKHRDDFQRHGSQSFSAKLVYFPKLHKQGMLVKVMPRRCQACGWLRVEGRDNERCWHIENIGDKDETVVWWRHSLYKTFIIYLLFSIVDIYASWRRDNKKQMWGIQLFINDLVAHELAGPDACNKYITVTPELRNAHCKQKPFQQCPCCWAQMRISSVRHIEMKNSW